MYHIGIAVVKCHGHAVSVRGKETTEVRIDANPDQSAQYKARDDPVVAAMLKSLGISKIEDYVYQDNKKLRKLVSYETTVLHALKAKYLIKNISQILPEFIDSDDEEVIDNVIDNIAKVGKQKRSPYFWSPTQDFTFLITTPPNTNTDLSTTDPTPSTASTPKPKLRMTEIELVINFYIFRIRIVWRRK